MALFISSNQITLARCAWIRQHPILRLVTRSNTHPYHHPIGRIFFHDEWSEWISRSKMYVSCFVVEIGWNIDKMFSYNSFHPRLEHHCHSNTSRICASPCTLSMIYLPSWRHDRCPQHHVSCTWNYVTMDQTEAFVYLKWRWHFPCRRCQRSLSSNHCMDSSVMNGHPSIYWPHPLSCPCWNVPIWSLPQMCRISVESTDQHSSTIIVVSMSSMHSSFMLIDLILTFTNEYHSAERSHLRYTLPWAFNEFVQLSIPDKAISPLVVSQLPGSSSISTNI